MGVRPILSLPTSLKCIYYGLCHMNVVIKIFLCRRRRRYRPRQRIKSDLYNQKRPGDQDFLSIDKFFNHPNRNKRPRYRRRKKNGFALPIQFPFIGWAKEKSLEWNGCENNQKSYYDFIPSINFMKTILCSF